MKYKQMCSRNIDHRRGELLKCLIVVMWKSLSWTSWADYALLVHTPVPANSKNCRAAPLSFAALNS